MFCPARLVQEGKLPVRICQELVFALPVQVQEYSGQILQSGNRNDHPAYAADIPASGRNFTVYGKCPAVVFDPFLREKLRGFAVIPRIEHSLHRRFIASRPDHVPVCPSPEDQVDGIHDDTLSGPGLTGQHVHTLMKPDCNVVDQCDLSDR